MTKTKISTLTKTAVAIAAGLAIICGLSFGVYSFVLKPYTPIITNISAADPSGAVRPNSEFQTGDTITIQGDNFLQSPYLWLDEVDAYFLNQNKQIIISEHWDNSVVAPKIASGEITKNSITKIAIPEEAPAALGAGGKLYLKLTFHFHKTWVGTKYNLTAQSSKPLALAVVPPPALSRQVAIPASWGLGDVNLNGAVNYDDLLALGSILKIKGDFNFQGDLNLNGIIDFSDYIILNYLIDSDGAFTSTDLPIILGNINRSEQNPTKPNTQITINDDDLDLLNNILTTQPALNYSTFLSADLNADNDLTLIEDRDVLLEFIDDIIDYNNLPLLVGPNYPPIASAGPDAARTVPDVPSQDITVALDGRGSIDREGDSLDYSWKILSADYPDGTTAAMLVSPLKTITNNQDEEAAYTLSKDNQNDLVKDTYVIVENQLTATDTKTQSATDVMQIAVTTPKTILGGNNPPVASFTAAPLTVAPGGIVNLDGLNSYDPDGAIVSFKWEVEPAGQGSFADDRASITTYAAPAAEGTYTIKLTVTDDQGATGSAEAGVEVKVGPESSIDLVLTDFRAYYSPYDGALQIDPYAGKPVDVQIFVTNTGSSDLNLATVPVNVRVTSHNGPTVTYNQHIDSFIFSSLKAGQSTSFWRTLPALAFPDIGDYGIYFDIESEGIISEKDYNNNGKELSIVALNFGQGQADLYVSELYTTIDGLRINPIKGRNNVMNVTVSNSGASVTDFVHGKFTVASVYEYDVEFKGINFGSVNAGTLLPDSAIPSIGDYIITFTIDTNGEVGEVDENNNSFSIPITVTE